MADSWKTDGNCKTCRRQNYCGKPCTASKRRATNFLLRAFRERTGTGLDKIQNFIEQELRR